MPTFGKTFNKLLFYLIIISLSISPAFATDPIDNRNYLLIGCMFLGPIIVLLSGKILPKIDIPILLLILLTFSTQLAFHPSTFRPSTVLFSCMFYIYFLAAVRCFIVANLSINSITILIKYLIYAYTIVLIIQQLCVIMGFPVFNLICDYSTHNPWKLNSLSAEPSHTARYLGVLMYTFLKLCDIARGHTIGLSSSFKEFKSVWLAFLWVMITMMSGTAMIILALILTRYLKPKNIAIIFTFLALIFTIGLTSDFKPLKRSTTFIQAVTTGDTNLMIKADHSASIRVVPLILCLQHIDPETIDGWVGKGVDSTSKWMSKKMPGVPHGWSGGAIANYILEYGLIVGFLFIVFSFWCCYDSNNKISTIGFWIMCVLFIGVNTQIGWLCIVLLFIDKRIHINHANTCVLR